MKVRQMMRAISELESIGDACYNQARILRRINESGRRMPKILINNLHAMMVLVDEALTQMNIVMEGQSKEYDIRDTYRIENDINSMRQRLKLENIRAVDDHEYDYAIGSMYIDIVNECEKLGDYVVNVMQARFGQ